MANFIKNYMADLAFGEEGEIEMLEKWFGVPVELVEVKTDRKTNNTGNVYFEYMSRGKKSGIATTESQIFIIRVDGFPGGMFFHVEELKKLLRPLIKTHTVKGGDDLTSRGILISVSELFKLKNSD